MIKLHIPGPGVLSVTIDTDPAVLLSLQDLVAREVIVERAVPKTVVDEPWAWTGFTSIPRKDSDGRDY